jgi:hypothetical protein
MPLQTVEADGRRIVEGTRHQPLMLRSQDATRVIEGCLSARTRRALLYPENLPPEFFDLSSAQAGELLDKLRRFQIRLAIVCAPGEVRFSTRFREILSDDLQVFESREQALQWLATADS